jgi:hypothetical protein
MVKLKEVPEEEINQILSPTGRMHRGRVSYPIVQAFLESGAKLAEVDASDHPKPVNLSQTLRAYCINHNLKCRVINRQGRIYLVKLTDEEWEDEQKKKSKGGSGRKPIDVRFDFDEPEKDSVPEDQK